MAHLSRISPLRQCIALRVTAVCKLESFLKPWLFTQSRYDHCDKICTSKNVFRSPSSHQTVRSYSLVASCNIDTPYTYVYIWKNSLTPPPLHCVSLINTISTLRHASLISSPSPRASRKEGLSYIYPEFYLFEAQCSWHVHASVKC